MHPDTDQTHLSSQTKLGGICKLAGKPKNCKDRAKVCLIKYNSREAGQEAEDKEKQMFEILCRYSSIICWLRFMESGQIMRFLYMLLYSFPGGKQRSTTQTLSCYLKHHPAPLPQFPHCYLLVTQALGRFVSPTSPSLRALGSFLSI